MLLESFQSGRHGNTFRLTQSTWQAEEKGHKQHFHRLDLGIRIFINYATHIIPMQPSQQQHKQVIYARTYQLLLVLESLGPPEEQEEQEDMHRLPEMEAKILQPRKSRKRWQRQVTYQPHSEAQLLQNANMAIIKVWSTKYGFSHE